MQTINGDNSRTMGDRMAIGAQEAKETATDWVVVAEAGTNMINSRTAKDSLRSGYSRIRRNCQTEKDVIVQAKSIMKEFIVEEHQLKVYHGPKISMELSYYRDRKATPPVGRAYSEFMEEMRTRL